MVRRFGLAGGSTSLEVGLRVASLTLLPVHSVLLEL